MTHMQSKEDMERPEDIECAFIHAVIVSVKHPCHARKHFVREQKRQSQTEMKNSSQ